MPASTRSPDARRIDAALLLTLWLRCAEQPREDAGDKLRQMKLAFLASHTLAEQRIHALNLHFYRWTWGPMSNEIYGVWDTLVSADLMKSEEHFVATRTGQSLARAFYEEVLRDERNADIRAVFDGIAAAWLGEQRTAPLLDAVYAMQIVPVGADESCSIREIRKGEELIEPVDPQEAYGSLVVERGWLETLAFELNPRLLALVKRGQADFREGRIGVA